MMIVSVSFHRPIQVGTETLTHWSANSCGSRIRAEESERGILLRPGRMQDGDFKPSGLLVTVPWINVDSMCQRAEQSAATPDFETSTRARSRTRMPKEVADDGE